jgi:tripartite-type tricarboxylate transporter receptor subunit TctC
VVAALADEETRRALLDQGGNPVGGTPDEFAAFLREETAKWGEVVRAANIRLE